MKGGNVDAIPKRPEEEKREIITRNARGYILFSLVPPQSNTSPD